MADIEKYKSKNNIKRWQQNDVCIIMMRIEIILMFSSLV